MSTHKFNIRLTLTLVSRLQLEGPPVLPNARVHAHACEWDTHMVVCVSRSELCVICVICVVLHT